MTNGEGFTASPILLLTIELPALDARTNLSFTVKPCRQDHVFDTVEDLVQGLLADREDYVSVDIDCTERKLATLRKEAANDVEEWQTKLRSAAEWKRKVESAGDRMNQMRNAYWKELLHWKEQAYRQKEAEKKGDDSWQPMLEMHFDPSEYHLDDEVTRLVNDKVQLVQQTWEGKMKELEVASRARITSLHESLVVAKMKLSRQDKMIQKLMDKAGYQDHVTQLQQEQAKLQAQLARHKDEGNLSALITDPGAEESFAQEISASIERKDRPRRHSVGAVSTSAGDLLSDDGAIVKEARWPRRNSAGNAVFRGGVLQDETDASSSSDSDSGFTQITSLSRPGSKGSKDSGKAQAGKKLNITYRRRSSTRTTSLSSRRRLTMECSQTVDAATDPMPFQEAFRKIELSSQACQCDIDSQVLDKAMEYLQKAAEDDWKKLNSMIDSTSEGESPKAKGSNASERHNTATPTSSMSSRRAFRKSRTFASASSSASTAASKWSSVRRKFWSNPTAARARFASGDSSESLHSQSARGSPSCGISFGISDKEEKQSGKASSVVALLSPRFVRKKSSIDVLPGSLKQGLDRDKEVQCKGVQCELLVSTPSSLEQRLPEESDPLEVQIKQLEHITGDVEKILPLMMARVEKLCSESGSVSEAAQRLRTRLADSMSIVPDLPDAKALSTRPQTRQEDRLTDSGRTSSSLMRRGSVEDVLQRHGVPVEGSACSSDPFERRERSSFSDDSRSFMKGLVGEASRMSFGSSASPRLSFNAPKNQRPRKISSVCNEMDMTMRPSTPLRKASGTWSPNPSTAECTPRSPASTTYSDASPLSQRPLKDVFSVGSRIKVAPKRTVLSDASLAIAEKLRKRKLLVDKADDGGEQIDTAGAEMMRTTQSECSPLGTLQTTTSSGRMTDGGPASGLDRATGNSEAGFRKSGFSAHDFFSDCDSVADHLDDVMLAEFKSENTCLTQDSKLEFSKGPGNVKKLQTYDLELDVQKRGKLAKLPNIRSPTPPAEFAKLPDIPSPTPSRASSKDSAPQSCQKLSLAEDAGIALRLSDRATEKPTRRTSLKRSTVSNAARRPTAMQVVQRRNSAQSEEASNPSSATRPSDAPSIAIFGQGQGQSQHGAVLSPQQPADHSPSRPETSNSKNPRLEPFRRRYTTH